MPGSVGSGAALGGGGGGGGAGGGGEVVPTRAEGMDGPGTPPTVTPGMLWPGSSGASVDGGGGWAPGIPTRRETLDAPAGWDVPPEADGDTRGPVGVDPGGAGRLGCGSPPTGDRLGMAERGAVGPGDAVPHPTTASSIAPPKTDLCRACHIRPNPARLFVIVVIDLLLPSRNSLGRAIRPHRDTA
jgi:hypothetical protein